MSNRKRNNHTTSDIDVSNDAALYGPYSESDDDDEEEEADTMMDTNVDERQRLLSEDDTRDNGKPPHSSKTLSYEDALLACGWGRFHFLLLVMCGWAVSSDAIEVLSISFVLPSATCDLALTSEDKGVLNSIAFLGMLIGGYFWGSLADRKGRRSVLVWSLMVNALGNLSSSVVQSFWAFLLFRLISGIGVGGSMPVIFTYFTEFQHKSKRGAMISLLATFWMGGNIVAASIAWLVIPREYLSLETSDFTYHSWRVFVALCSIPALTSALMFVLMPESPKFLLHKGRSVDAMSVLQRVHASNKSQNPLEMENLVLTYDAEDPSKSNDDSENDGCMQTLRRLLASTLTLFNKELRRRSIALLVINFTLSFGYYGLFLWFPELFKRVDENGGSFCDAQAANTSTSISCDVPSDEVFFDSFLTSISNLPGNILSFFLVDRVGRKVILVVSMSLSGLSVFLLYFIKTKWQSVLMSCVFGAISVCGFNMLDVLQVELFPTEVRSTAFGVQTMSVRVGAILGNVVFGVLVDVNCAVPMLMVASLLTFGSLVSILLPNTKAVDIH